MIDIGGKGRRGYESRKRKKMMGTGQEEEEDNGEEQIKRERQKDSEKFLGI